MVGPPAPAASNIDAGTAAIHAGFSPARQSLRPSIGAAIPCPPESMNAVIGRRFALN